MMPNLSAIGCFFLYGCSVQEAGAQQGHRHSRVQAIWCRARGSGAEQSWCRKQGRAQQSAGWGRVEARCTQAVRDPQQGVGRSAAGHRLQCSRAQAPVQQGAGSGGARHRLGCSKAQARVQQDASSGAARRNLRCSRARAQQGAGAAGRRHRCSRAQAQVQQGTGAGAASKGAQEGLFAASKTEKGGFQTPFSFLFLFFSVIGLDLSIHFDELHPSTF
ncbi:hypothetical protein SLEP1_g55176 [Rubroshorea leprosula]|uniref:Uncharacterized protein n=1 Tax=Rubroshorea leprosula TaxID=152421 RepID=A0AAV5MEL1_9ROSI|nr:hypothetical protein SLEP1_g55176 [Rubroshorea leprosula]